MMAMASRGRKIDGILLMRIASKTQAEQRKTDGATHNPHCQSLHHALARLGSVSSEPNSFLDDFKGASEGEEEAAALVFITIACAGSTDGFESKRDGMVDRPEAGP
jgi:hypothetical protein